MTRLSRHEGYPREDDGAIENGESSSLCFSANTLKQRSGRNRYGQTTSRKEAVRTYFSMLGPLRLPSLLFKAIPGGNKDDPSLQDNVEIPFIYNLNINMKIGWKGQGYDKNPNSQSLLVSFIMKLGCPVPQQMARPACANSTVAKPVDEARLPEFTAYSATEDTDDPRGMGWEWRGEVLLLGDAGGGGELQEDVDSGMRGEAAGSQAGGCASGSQHWKEDGDLQGDASHLESRGGRRAWSLTCIAFTSSLRVK